MNRITTTLAAACFALSAPAAFAQAPHGDHKGDSRPRMSHEQREKMHEHMKAARETCKDSKDRRACMTGAMCAKAPDPAKCQAMAKERHAKFSQHMDEHKGDMAGFAKLCGYFRVSPEARSGQAVLVVQTTEGAPRPPPVEAQKGPKKETQSPQAPSGAPRQGGGSRRPKRRR